MRSCVCTTGKSKEASLGQLPQRCAECAAATRNQLEPPHPLPANHTPHLPSRVTFGLCSDARSLVPPSAQEAALTGLNLLRLLVANRIAEFHTELEASRLPARSCCTASCCPCMPCYARLVGSWAPTLAHPVAHAWPRHQAPAPLAPATLQVVPEEVQAAPEVAQVVQLEQWLMEGAYNKVGWRGGWGWGWVGGGVGGGRRGQAVALDRSGACWQEQGNQQGLPFSRVAHANPSACAARRPRLSGRCWRLARPPLTTTTATSWTSCPPPCGELRSVPARASPRRRVCGTACWNWRCRCLCCTVRRPTYHTRCTPQQPHWQGRQRCTPRPRTRRVVLLLPDACRDEVASCSERAYESLSLSDAVGLLMLGSEAEVEAYAREVRAGSVEWWLRADLFGLAASPCLGKTWQLAQSALHPAALPPHTATATPPCSMAGRWQAGASLSSPQAAGMVAATALRVVPRLRRPPWSSLGTA